MTKIEAIEWLEKDIKLHEVFNETKHQNKAIEALNMAIDALTKEPEEDCISREWVMDLYEEWKPMLATNVDGFGYALKCAPSVVPKREIPPNMKQVLIPKYCIVTPNDEVPSAAPKRGKWIDVEYQLGMQCSECGKMCNEITLCTDMMTEAHWNYCPNCGSYNGGDTK